MLRNFGGDNTEKETTKKLNFSEFTDFDKQIVYIEVNDPAESKSILIFELGLLLLCHVGYYDQKLVNNP